MRPATVLIDQSATLVSRPATLPNQPEAPPHQATATTDALDLADRASSLFEQYDEDGDGYIDEAELGHLTLTLTLPLTLILTSTPTLTLALTLTLTLTLDQAELGNLLQSMRLTELGVTEQMVGHFVAQASTLQIITLTHSRLHLWV